MNWKHIQSTLLLALLLLPAIGVSQDSVRLELHKREAVDDKGYKRVWTEYIDDAGSPVIHGAVEAYYPDGKLFSITEYKDGLPDGEITTWFENGQVKMSGHISGDNKIGLWKYYYEDGSNYREVEYLEDRPYGRSIKWYEDGQLHEKGYFKDGKREGFWTTWYPSGQKRSEGTYVDGKRDSTWSWWHKNGKISSTGDMMVGKHIFDWKDWYEDGQPEKIYSYDSLGQMIGDYFEFYPDGSKKTVGFSKNGKKHGHWTEWNEDGSIKFDAEFDEGIKIEDSIGVAGN
ncbi:MAG: toxin-antitoxin system YwqK family antitoxin [Candidatus Zixiibacteriota bacterium]